MSVALTTLSEASLSSLGGSQSGPKTPPKRKLEAQRDSQLAPEPR